MLDATKSLSRDSIFSYAVAGGEANIAITPLAPRARFVLRMASGAAAQLNTIEGFRLKTPINTCFGTGEKRAARLGPSEWLLTGPEQDSETLERAISERLANHFFSLVDIGHRDVTIGVTGRHSVEVINAGCPLDLCENAFPGGSATRTVFGKTEIVLTRCGPELSFTVECLRSLGPYVNAFLNQAAKEFRTG
jgi:sarcosine oxidase subunit gamma